MIKRSFQVKISNLEVCIKIWWPPSTDGDEKGNINKCDLILDNGQPLADLYNSVSQYFPNDQYTIFQYHTWVKDPLKGHDRAVDLIFYFIRFHLFIYL